MQSEQPPAETTGARLGAATPVLFVRDVTTAAAFYRDRLGFDIDFLHGSPPFYGSVTRNRATVHLKFVSEQVYVDGVVPREGLIMAFVAVENVKTLCAEYTAAGVEVVQKLTEQAWGGIDFIVRDPDGNAISFVG